MIQDELDATSSVLLLLPPGRCCFRPAMFPSLSPACSVAGVFRALRFGRFPFTGVCARVFHSQS